MGMQTHNTSYLVEEKDYEQSNGGQLPFSLLKEVRATKMCCRKDSELTRTCPGQPQVRA